MRAATDAAPAGTPSVPRKLSVPEKALLALEVIRAYIQARLLLRRGTLPAALEQLRATDAVEHSETRREDLIEGIRLGQVVGRVLRPLPTETRCLARSLVLTRLLARRGVGSKLVIGVRPGETFGAHAWVEADGQPLLPGGGLEFERLVEL